MLKKAALLASVTLIIIQILPILILSCNNNQLNFNSISFNNKNSSKNELIEYKQNFIDFEKAKQIALKVISKFEGYGPSGNGDHAGLSLGYFQWNFKNRNLQKMLKEMASGNIVEDSDKDFNEIFNKVDPSTGKLCSEVLRNILKSNYNTQMKWAHSISRYNSSNTLKEPWQSAFLELAKNEKFKIIQEKFAEPYIKNAIKIMTNDLQIPSVKGFTLALDISVNNGSIGKDTNYIYDALSGKLNYLNNSNDKFFNNISNYKKRKADKKVISELHKKVLVTETQEIKKMYYFAAAAAIKKPYGFSIDSWKRKIAIIEGHGIVHGEETSSLLKDVDDRLIIITKEQ